jgi:hypothetical protein
MTCPLLTLSWDLIADGVLCHPYLEAIDLRGVSADAPLPTRHFAICETPLPADFCTCGRYMLFVPDDDEDCSECPPS